MWLSLAKKLLDNHLTEESIKFSERVEDHLMIDYRKLMASLMLKREENEKAEELIIELLSKLLLLDSYPAERDLWVQLKECQAKLGKSDKQEKTLIKLIGFRQGIDELLIEYGMLKLAQGKHADARVILDKAVQANQTSVIAHMMLGVACIQVEQYEDARRALSSANILDPTNQEIWIYLCMIALKVSPLVPTTDLQACLRECIKLQVEDEELMLRLANALFERKFYRECLFVARRIEAYYDSANIGGDPHSMITDLIASAEQELGKEDSSAFE